MDATGSFGQFKEPFNKGWKTAYHLPHLLHYDVIDVIGSAEYDDMHAKDKSKSYSSQCMRRSLPFV